MLKFVQRAVNTLQYFVTALAIFRAVKDLVEEFEAPGFGEEKKKAVLDTINAIYDTFESVVPIERDEVLTLAEKFIDIIVRVYNIIGKFKRDGLGNPELGNSSEG